MLRLVLLTLAGMTLLAAALCYWVYRAFESDLPATLDAVTDYSPMRASQVLSADGELIGEFFVEKRVLVPLSEIPKHVRHAFVAAEDERFYSHGGVDYLGIVRAALANLRAGSIVQGGSTITQQVAKLLILGQERSLARKIREALLAYRIERRLSKDEILGIYLNHVYLGHGAYGIAAAAQAYFGKTVPDLSVAEAAMLAAMPKAPGQATPFRNFKRAKARQAYVLGQMQTLGYLRPAEAAAAREEALVLVSRGRTLRNVAAPYFVEEVRRHLVERYGEEDLLMHGLRIHTTLDMRLQRAAEAALKSGLEALDAKLAFSGPVEHLAGERLESFLVGHPRFFVPDQDALLDPEQRGYLLPDADEDPDVPGGTLDATQPGALLSDHAARVLLSRVHAARTSAHRRAPTTLSAAGAPPATPRIVPDTPYAAAILSIDAELLLGSGRVRARLDAEGSRHVRAFRDARARGQPVRLGDVIAVLLEPGAPGQPLRARLVQEPTVQGALLALHPQTGRLLAMVGGYDYEKSQFNRATQARRQIGSTVKPFIYAAALEAGMSPLTVRWDVPVKFRTASGIWAPRNYRPEYLGRITLRTALEKSINTVAAQLVAELGTTRIIELMRRAGITSKLPHALSLALGTADLSPYELGYGLASLAAQGRHVEPISIVRVFDADGNLLEASAATSARSSEGVVVSPETAYVLTQMMMAVTETGTARGARALGRPVAGKTGTSTGFRDAWFVGYTPDLLCVVWVGRDDFRPIGHDMTGGRVALPIWLNFMREALATQAPADFQAPPGVYFVRADVRTGQPALPSSPGTKLVPIARGTMPPVFQQRERDREFSGSEF